MPTELSNHLKLQLTSGNIDFDSDSFKVVLMNTGFTFDKDTHATYANVSASELATEYGYTQNTKTLQASTVTEDDTNDRASVTFADDGTYSKDVGWTASGGSIGPSPGAIIFDDTSSDDTVVGYIDFSSDQTATDGNDFTIDAITIHLT